MHAESRARALRRDTVVALVGFALLVALSLVGTGCAPHSPALAERTQRLDPATELSDAPAWVTDGCRAFWRDPAQRKRVVCGIGSAPSTRNRVATRETAIARARASVGRSLEVTIESLVRLQENGTDDPDLETIAHQLSSTSMRGLAIESVWHAPSGEVHALVSVDLDRVQESVRNSETLSPDARDDLAERAAAAFAALDRRDGRDGRDPQTPDRSGEETPPHDD